MRTSVSAIAAKPWDSGGKAMACVRRAIFSTASGANARAMWWGRFSSLAWKYARNTDSVLEGDNESEDIARASVMVSSVWVWDIRP
ncbi:hypothetical protein D3C71_1644980 [compost metagenome]